MVEGWQERLRANGYRVTPQRQFVLAAVEELRHGTPEEILARVQDTSSGVNISTIYRTLEVLEDVGLVTHAHIGHGAPTYHAVDDVPHIHLVCRGCGAVDSVPAVIALGFLEALEREHGFATDVSHLSLHGRCRRCPST